MSRRLHAHGGVGTVLECAVPRCSARMRRALEAGRSRPASAPWMPAVGETDLADDRDAVGEGGSASTQIERGDARERPRATGGSDARDRGGGRDRGDAMVVWSLLLAILLLPLGGLSVDLWHGIAVQRQLQSAAEDAATAGASGIDIAVYRRSGCIVLDPAVAVPLAQANLASQAGLGSLASVDVEVAPAGNEITVVLRKDVHLTLLKLVEGDRPLVVTAEATSQPVGSVSGNGCP